MAWRPASSCQDLLEEQPINPDIDPLSINSLTNSLHEMLPAGAASGFSAINIIFGIIFGAIGFIVFSYGKSNAKLKPLVIGVALIAYPYFIYNTYALLFIGIGLLGLLYILRD